MCLVRKLEIGTNYVDSARNHEFNVTSNAFNVYPDQRSNTNECPMRRLSPCDALFPKIRQRIIGLLFANPEKWTYQAEMVKDLQVSQSSIQLELRRLITSGILEAVVRGNRVYLRPDKSCIIFD